MLSPVPELNVTGEDMSILAGGDEFAFTTCTSYSPKLTGLPHVVGSTLILEVLNGGNYRIDVPKLSLTKLGNYCVYR